jgi:iron-sulfur cluster repair protein YtfE (RIC family)
MKDPIRQFEHSHAKLTELALEVREIVRAEPDAARSSAKVRRRFVELLRRLREELLRHFAIEEEGLFPFVRANVPARSGVVDRLAEAHDTICGTLLRLAHHAEHDRDALRTRRAKLTSLYERFESAYTHHSQDEAALLEELGRTLEDRQRADLAEVLRGL